MVIFYRLFMIHLETFQNNLNFPIFTDSSQICFFLELDFGFSLAAHLIAFIEQNALPRSILIALIYFADCMIFSFSNPIAALESICFYFLCSLIFLRIK